MPETREHVLPPWTEELKDRYLRGEALQFVLHGNVNDLVEADGSFIQMSDFLSEVLLAPSKDVVIQYNVATGIRFAKKRAEGPGREQLLTLREPDKILPAPAELAPAVHNVSVTSD